MNFKKTMKVIAFIALSFVLFQATMVLSFAQENTMKEEATTLENIYQEKVRAALNNLMAPEDYTLVISATLKNDEQRLKEYNEAVEKKFLPGLIITDPMGYSDAHNILMDLKQKVEVQVILSENVPSDRDGLVKDILKNKLHLSEESGDVINVVRAAKNAEPPAHTTPSKLPELSAKMIAFWIMVCMLALTGIIFWLQRRKEKAKEEAAKAEQAIKIEQAEAEAKKEEELAEAQEAAPVSTALTEEQKNELEVKLAYIKGELIRLAHEYPHIVALAAEEFVAQGRVKETVLFMEAIGWDESKRIFNEVGGRFWGKVGVALRERENDPSLTETNAAVQVFYRFALSFVLERTSKEGENPFNFIFQLTENERRDLLEQERAENIALIGVYCNGSQMGELLQGMDTAKQNDVLVHLTKFKQMPENEIKQGADKLLIQLDRIKADPSVYADGPMLAADFLRSLPASREEELVQYLMTDHPTEGDKLRRVRVLFQDLTSYPSETVKKVIETFESEEIQRSLVGYDPEFVESFLSLLPTKKALMIQNDLFHMTEFPPLSQCAESRRKICQRVEEEFETQRFSLSEHWKNAELTQVDNGPGFVDTSSENTQSYEGNVTEFQPQTTEEDENKAA